MTIKEFRKDINVSGRAAAECCNMSLKTFYRYENDDNYGNKNIRTFILNRLDEVFSITEEKNVLTIDRIRDICNEVFVKYGNNISFCYLFGSYSKGLAKGNSDVDLCVETFLEGLDFVGLIEELREALHKKVDLIRLKDQGDNIVLLTEIMKDGIKIYDSRQK